MCLDPTNEQARKWVGDAARRGVQADGGIYYQSRPTRRQSETCETGMCLAIAAYFVVRDQRLHGLVDRLVDVQLSGGGWNCRWARGAAHSSFHTTI